MINDHYVNIIYSYQLSISNIDRSIIERDDRQLSHAIAGINKSPKDWINFVNVILIYRRINIRAMNDLNQVAI